MADATPDSKAEGMPDQPNGKDIPSELNPAVLNQARTIIEPLNNSIAAGSMCALKLGVPAHAVIEMHMNHLASVIAQLEPPGLRLSVIEDVVRQISSLVRSHVDVRNRTAGGVILPRAGL